MDGEVAENNFGIIYKATNLTNGKVYIGQTSYTLDKRKSEHEYWATQLEKKSIFYQAIRKYGKDIFTWEVIDHASNEDELNNKEIYWIEKFKSYVGFKDSHGYNMTLGGEGRVGYTHYEETKEKIGNAIRGMFSYENHPKARPVMQFTTDGKFIEKYLTAKHGAEAIGCPLQNITDCCRNDKQKTVYGFVWIYEDEYTEALLKQRIRELPKMSNKALAVEQYDLNGNLISTYHSAHNASKETNSDKSSILKCCKGKLKKHNGFIWKFTK